MPMDIFTLDEYKNFLNYLKDNNFLVINFKDLHNTFNSYENLPSKIVVLRHDIHVRDIDNAYNMIDLEQKIFKKNVATYFVQWNFEGSTEYEKNYEKNNQGKYYDFIQYCIKKNIDVQPHISLYCSSFKNLYNFDNNNICFCKDNIKINFLDNNNLLKDTINEQSYNIDVPMICIECDHDNEYLYSEIETLSDDIVSYLTKYKKDWDKEFNKAYLFSCHGDGLLLTKTLNPNFFASKKNIETIIANANTTNIYLGKNSIYKLKYKSDNSCNKEQILEQIYNNDNVYQLLIHPYIWSKK